MARSRSRSEPRHQAVAFTDRRDSHSTFLPGWGGPYFRPNVATALPPTRSNVHRLLSRIRDAAIPVGYGANKPRASLNFTPVRHQLLGAIASRQLRTPIRPLQAQRIADSWRAFNVLRFPNPRRVQVCLRRKARKEVLHALGIAGRRGLGRGAGVHRNADSSWSC